MFLNKFLNFLRPESVKKRNKFPFCLIVLFPVKKPSRSKNHPLDYSLQKRFNRACFFSSPLPIISLKKSNTSKQMPSLNPSRGSSR